MESIEKRDLKKLNRGELLEIIFQLKKSEKVLEQKLAETQSNLNKREILMKESGSIAEAALRLNDIFGAAQRAVDSYTSSVQLNYAQMEEKIAQAKIKGQQIVKKAQLEADEILQDAQLQKARIVEEAEQTVRDKERVFHQTIEKALSSHSELRMLLEQRR